jgi:isopentenyl-diphosphate delta-isomerase
VDTDADIASGAVPGAKAAAVRKLQHELGIDPAALPASSFTYLTRLHYCAADTDTHGPTSPWGEHEVDYILLAQADVELAPNPEEVQVRAGALGGGGVGGWVGGGRVA